jgi:hypothetical protein
LFEPAPQPFYPVWWVPKQMPETLFDFEPGFRHWMAFAQELSLLNGQGQFGLHRTVNDVLEVSQGHDRGSMIWSYHVRTG